MRGGEKIGIIVRHAERAVNPLRVLVFTTLFSAYTHMVEFNFGLGKSKKDDQATGTAADGSQPADDATVTDPVVTDDQSGGVAGQMMDAAVALVNDPFGDGQDAGGGAATEPVIEAVEPVAEAAPVETAAVDPFAAPAPAGAEGVADPFATPAAEVAPAETMAVDPFAAPAPAGAEGVADPFATPAAEVAPAEIMAVDPFAAPEPVGAEGVADPFATPAAEVVPVETAAADPFAAPAPALAEGVTDPFAASAAEVAPAETMAVDPFAAPAPAETTAEAAMPAIEPASTSPSGEQAAAVLGVLAGAATQGADKKEVEKSVETETSSAKIEPVEEVVADVAPAETAPVVVPETVAVPVVDEPTLAEPAPAEMPMLEVPAPIETMTPVETPTEFPSAEVSQRETKDNAMEVGGGDPFATIGRLRGEIEAYIKIHKEAIATHEEEIEVIRQEAKAKIKVKQGEIAAEKALLAEKNDEFKRMVRELSDLTGMLDEHTAEKKKTTKTDKPKEEKKMEKKSLLKKGGKGGYKPKGHRKGGKKPY